MAILEPGTEAPDFRLNVTPDQALSLHELRGKPVILFFYPADWSPVCGEQTTLYNEILPEFERYRAQLVGVSVDSAWCHAAFAKQNHLRYPLASDFEPKGSIAKKYGAYRKKGGFAERAVFVLDSDGIIFWSYCSPVAVNPGADGILDALENLSKEQRRSDDKAERSTFAA
jgi:peroxiredoxin